MIGWVGVRMFLLPCFQSICFFFGGFALFCTVLALLLDSVTHTHTEASVVCLHHSFFLNWSTVDLQYCVSSGMQGSESFMYIYIYFMGKPMATHSSVLAWRIPGMAEPGGLLSMGWHRVRHDWSNLAAAAVAYIFQIIFYYRLLHDIEYNFLCWASLVAQW